MTIEKYITEVILVDENDVQIGTMEKLQAHIEGRLHRAFSVFVINDKSEILLQKRAAGKYHSAGLWSNSCCSHPLPGESITNASIRRLNEELGIEVKDLTHLYSFIYKAEFKNSLTEFELDHVLLAYFNGVPNVNTDEISDWHYFSIPEIKKMMNDQPALFTVWFKLIIPEIEKYIKEK